jgi:hypothetical protein
MVAEQTLQQTYSRLGMSAIALAFLALATNPSLLPPINVLPPPLPSVGQPTQIAPPVAQNPALRQRLFCAGFVTGMVAFIALVAPRVVLARRREPPEGNHVWSRILTRNGRRARM